MLVCSQVVSGETSTSLTHVGKPAVEVTCPAATAQALATSLVDCIISSRHVEARPRGYHLLCQLALADVQGGNERMKGVALYVTAAVLKVKWARADWVTMHAAQDCAAFHSITYCAALFNSVNTLLLGMTANASAR